MSEDLCSICQESLHSAHTEALKPCNHTFHSSCIIKALRRSGRCPICRDPGEDGPREDDEHATDHGELFGFDDGVAVDMVGSGDDNNSSESDEPTSELEEDMAFMYVRKSVLEEIKVALRSRRLVADAAWTALFCELVAWSPPNETAMELSNWQPGWYEIMHHAGVSDDMELAPHPRESAFKGQIVRVLEIAQRDDLHRIRGRLESPAGWISLVNLQSGSRWVKVAEHLPEHVKRIPVCEQLVPLQMLKVAALLDIRTKSRWRQRLREQLGRASAEDSEVRRVGLRRLGELLVQAELRTEVMRKQGELVPDEIMVGELEAGLVSEDGDYHKACYWATPTFVETLKSKLEYDSKEALKAEVINFFTKLRHCSFSRHNRCDIKPREPLRGLIGDAALQDLYEKLAHKPWDPVREAELLIQAEEDLGLSRPMRCGTKRMKAAKAKSRTAQNPDYIGDPDWNLRPRYCAEQALQAEQRFNTFIRERLSAERAREMLAAYCLGGPASAPNPKTSKTKAKATAKTRAKKNSSAGVRADAKGQSAAKVRAKPLVMKRTKQRR